VTTTTPLLIGVGLFLSACAADPGYDPPTYAYGPIRIRSTARSISTMAAGAVGIMAGIMATGTMPVGATVSPDIPPSPDTVASAGLVVEATAS
jgi:hypothetical protein